MSLLLWMQLAHCLKHTSRVVPPYDRDRYFDFYQFYDNDDPQIVEESDNYLNCFSKSIIEIHAMVARTLTVLNVERSKHEPDNPSFLRNFQKDDFCYVVSILERVLAITGFPGMDALLASLGLEKMEIYYSDPEFVEGDDAKCQNPTTNAYLSVYQSEITHENVDYVVICPRVFQLYRSFGDFNLARLLVDKVVHLGCPRQWDEPLMSTSLVLLHGKLKRYDSLLEILTDIDTSQNCCTIPMLIDRCQIGSRLTTCS